MNNLEKLFENYKQFVSVGKKNTTEIVNHIKSKGVVEVLPINEIWPSVLGGLIFNIKYKNHVGCMPDDVSLYQQNPEQFMQNGEYKFVAYKFPRTPENDVFYNNYKLSQDDVEKYIYIIFEINSNYIFCNCPQLQLELLIYRGISDYDVKHKTLEFYAYLSYLEALDTKCY